MDHLIETANYAWFLIAGIVGVIAWFLRQENRISNNEKRLVAIEESIQAEVAARKQALYDLRADSDKQVLTMWSKIDLMNASIVQILQATARLETVLKMKQHKE